VEAIPTKPAWRTDYPMEFVRWYPLANPGDIPSYVGVNDVTERLKSVEWETGHVELYDLAADPWEMESKCQGQLPTPTCEPAYVEVRERLAARLVEMMQ
jgi:hypothetical protein